MGKADFSDAWRQRLAPRTIASKTTFDLMIEAALASAKALAVRVKIGALPVPPDRGLALGRTGLGLRRDHAAKIRFGFPLRRITAVAGIIPSRIAK